MSLKLSPNFSLHEVSKSSTASRNEIDNTVPVSLIPNARAVAKNILQPIRDEFGAFSPQSWYRCEALERLLCNKSYIRYCSHNSLSPMSPGAWMQYLARKSHPKAEAVDIEIPGVANAVLFNWCKHHLEFDQLIYEYGSKTDPTAGWIHVSYSTSYNRNQIKYVK